MTAELRVASVMPIGQERTTGGVFAVVLLAIALSSHPAWAAGPKLVVAISPDIPPYVMQHATKGLEVDLLRRALPDYDLRFVQVPYDRLPAALDEKQADLSIGVQRAKDGGFYSVDCIAFANYAITKKADGLKIDSVADLANHPVLAWQNAYLQLDEAFKQLYSPGSSQRKNYKEFADQGEQVKAFWQAGNKIIVIDNSIFRYFSKQQRHSISEVEFHAIFPPVTNVKVAFKRAAVRDQFDRRLAKLCQSGEYAKLLERYHMELPITICDREAVRQAAAQFYAALNALFKGDVAPMVDVWSHAADVSYMGPAGGVQVGWDEVRANWEVQAALKLGGEVKPQDMHITVGRDLAVTHNYETGKNFPDDQGQDVNIRATNLFRKEGGQWKMIGHHTDLLPFLEKDE